MRPTHTYFLDIPEDVANDPTGPYAVLPVPYERTVSYGTGTINGPASVLDASHEIEDYDSELGVPLDLRVQTLPPLRLERLQDDPALALIENAARSVASNGRFLLGLGGEHTITSALIRPLHEILRDLGVLHLDAHLDLRDTYEDSRLSHACVARRVHEMGIPITMLGIRSGSAEEFHYARDQDIPIHHAHEIPDDPIEWVQSKLIPSLPDTLYVTLDIDVMDPSTAPGTGTPEPGGLTWRQITGILREVILTRTVVGADIVEVAPIPGQHVTEFLAARLAAKLLTYHRYRG